MEPLYEQGYKCKECEFTTCSGSEIREHITLAHQKRRPLICPDVNTAVKKPATKRGRPKPEAPFEDLATVEEPVVEEPPDVQCKVEILSEFEEDALEDDDYASVKKIEERHGIKVPGFGVSGKCPICSKANVSHLRVHISTVHAKGKGGRPRLTQGPPSVTPSKKRKRRGVQTRGGGLVQTDEDTDDEDPKGSRSRLKLAPSQVRDHIPKLNDQDDPGTRCPYCQKDFADESSIYAQVSKMKVHIMSVHKPKAGVDCPVCGTSISENYLVSHIKNKHCITQFEKSSCLSKGCEYVCDTTRINYKTSYRSHLMKFHHLGEAAAKVQLEKWLENEGNAAAKVKEEPRLNDEAVRALATNGRIKWEEGLTVLGVANRAIDSQIRPEHRIKAGDMMPWLRNCSSCRLTFATEQEREKHDVQMHRANAPMPKYVGKNVSNTSTGYKVKCADCPDPRTACVFTSMDELEAHACTNHYEKDYVCAICSKVLPTFELYFKQHLREHCQFDQVGFPLCPWCGKQMGRYDKGRKDREIAKNYNHMSVHIPPKYWNDDWTCTFCKRRTFSTGARKAHEFSDHKRELGITPTTEKFACDRCPMVYPKKEYLAKHLKQKHSSDLASV